MSDRPKNLPPSASEMPRIYGCPGYLHLKRALALPPQPSSDDAKSGTRCHAAYGGEIVKDLTDDEEIAVARAVRMTDELAEALGFKTFIAERRLFAGTSLTGQPDRIYIDGLRAFIPDAKFGRNEVETADANKQLRAYVALVAYNWPEVTEIYAAIVQPWASGKPVPAHYGIQEIGTALAEVFGVIAKSDLPGAPRVVGHHCKYCQVMAHCPEANSSVVGLTGASNCDIQRASPDQIASFLESAPLAEDVIEAVRVEAKRRLAEDPLAIPGWALKPGLITETISDPEAVFARAERIGVKQSAFMGCVTIGKEKLKAAIKAATGHKGRDLETMLDSVLLNATTAKQSAMTLAKSKHETTTTEEIL